MRVGCRLPNGLVIENPLNPAITKELAGANKAVIIGSDTGFTEVDDGFWGLWKAANKDFPALVNGAIYEADGHDATEAIGRNKDGAKTGFEQNDPKLFGVKPADKAD